MRKTKLIYVENDPALRGLMSGVLSKADQVDLIGVFSDASELLRSGKAESADAALIDYALDSEGLNGVELGIQLRNLNELIGIVIYSQFSISPMVYRVPESMLGGWSFMQKRATATREDYVSAIQSAVTGKGNWPEIVSETMDDLESGASMFFRLSPRQRSIMALAAKSKSAREIAVQLDVSYVHVRKELSRVYDILLPNAEPGDDLKTAAVFKYLELMKAAQ